MANKCYKCWNPQRSECLIKPCKKGASGLPVKRSHTTEQVGWCPFPKGDLSNTLTAQKTLLILAKLMCFRKVQKRWRSISRTNQFLDERGTQTIRKKMRMLRIPYQTLQKQSILIKSKAALHESGIDAPTDATNHYIAARQVSPPCWSKHLIIPCKNEMFEKSTEAMKVHLRDKPVSGWAWNENEWTGTGMIRIPHKHLQNILLWHDHFLEMDWWCPTNGTNIGTQKDQNIL